MLPEDNRNHTQIPYRIIRNQGPRVSREFPSQQLSRSRAAVDALCPPLDPINLSVPPQSRSLQRDPMDQLLPSEAEQLEVRTTEQCLLCLK